jgi:hypothetical protein
MRISEEDVMKRKHALGAALVGACLALTPVAWAQDDSASLASQYAAWAGGSSNAQALVGGLREGRSITLVTSGPGRSVSLAGFTPAAPMSPAQVRSALARAQSTLNALGISRPDADQIQTALIGGEIALPGGGSRQVAGVVGVQGTGPVASR